MLGEQELAEYWALLREIETLAFTDLQSLFRQLDTGDKDTLMRGLRAGVPEIVDLYRNTAADTAMLFYEETQGLEFDARAGVAASKVNEDWLDASLRWAVYAPGNTKQLGLVAGIVQQAVLDGARNYALQGFANQKAGWYRAAQPGACAFCRMLASRSASEWRPYSSAEAAVTVGRGKSRARGSRPNGGRFHKHCHCIPVRADAYEAPDYVNEWTEQYYRATEELGNAGATKQILSLMRQYDSA